MNYSPSFSYHDEKTTPQRERVRINVSGEMFETFEDTLARYPSTLLGSKTKRSQYFNSKRSEYCFNRDRAVFNSILFYYQSPGILSKPETVSYEIFFKETAFFELETDCMGKTDPTAKWHYTSQRRKRTLRGRIWQSLENPRSSAERLVNKLSGLITLLSLAALCWDTIPEVRKVNPHQNNNTVVHMGNFNDNAKPFYNGHQFWFLTESIFSGWFTIEYFARLATAPKTIPFLTSFSAVVDLLSILPFYVTLALRFSTQNTGYIPLLRVSRLVRILKLKRYSTSVRLLFETIGDSYQELQVFFLCLVFITVIMSSAIYQIEGMGEHSQFISIPDVFWYSFVTLSSVGYGDYVPRTEFGKVIGAVFCVSGVVVIFCFSPVLFAKFRRCRYRLFKEQLELQIYRDELDKIYNQNITEKKRESHGIKRK
ncbi:potassium voltage-gated channel subfamily A member 2 [Exaiptasia diaphana]|uniref:Potassium channel n=1 Tax=Exaiptasia diaphana TaxID=2652724 RepID=A0A913XEZ5_EXADI|nr:potassium voltage-gated channel subfamily A member 2 [Exaiptasia diaphana]